MFLSIFFLNDGVFVRWSLLVSLVAQMVKNPPAMWETWVQSLGWEDQLEKRQATHSRILGLPSWLTQ